VSFAPEYNDKSSWSDGVDFCSPQPSPIQELLPSDASVKVNVFNMGESGGGGGGASPAAAPPSQGQGQSSSGNRLSVLLSGLRFFFRD